jgi:hypothetical protein
MVASALPVRSCNPSPLLLCHHAPQQALHRQVLSDYIKRRAGCASETIVRCRCKALTGGFRAFAIALSRRLRLDDFGIEDQSMQPKSQHWIWMTLVVLALAAISYLAMPPAVIKQATALLSWG